MPSPCCFLSVYLPSEGTYTYSYSYSFSIHDSLLDTFLLLIYVTRISSLSQVVVTNHMTTNPNNLTCLLGQPVFTTFNQSPTPFQTVLVGGFIANGSNTKWRTKTFVSQSSIASSVLSFDNHAMSWFREDLVGLHPSGTAACNHRWQWSLPQTLPVSRPRETCPRPAEDARLFHSQGSHTC